MNDRYREYKYHNWRSCQLSLDFGLTQLQHLPLELQIELTNLCNLHCVMCPAQFFNSTKQSLEYEQLEKIKSLFGSALRVMPFGGGEPLLYPHFLETIEEAKKPGWKLSSIPMAPS